MALKGDLGSIDLAHVFQMLTMSQKTGTLEIHTSSGRKRLYFEPRGILFEYDQETFPECVAQQLQARPGITAEAMELARTHVDHRGIDLLTALIEMSAVNEEQVQLTFRERMEEEIYDLFLTGDISFEFYENERLEEDGRGFDEALVLSPNMLIMEAARRLDEWNFIQTHLPSDSCILEVAAELSEMQDLDSDCPFEDVYGAIDGFRSITALVEHTGLSRYQVCRALARMVEQRIVDQVHPELLVTRAKTLLDDGQPDQGVVLLERALDQGHGSPEVYLLAAEANEGLHRYRRAASLLTRLAETQEEEGQRDEATLTRLRVRLMLPTELAVREQVMRHFFDDPSFFQGLDLDLVDEVEQLAWMLQYVGREDAARDVLVGLHLRLKDDWKVTQRVSRIAVEMGAPKTAVQILLDSAERYYSKQNWQHALRLYHRIRTIDSSHPGLDTRIRACQKACDSSSPKVRQLLRRAIVVLVSAGVAGGYLHYNHRALREFRALSTEERAVQGNFRDALRQLDQFRDSYPATVTSLVAASRMEALEDRERAYQAQQVTEGELLKVESERRQARAERRYEEAEAHIRAGQYPKALAALREVNQLATNDEWKESEGVGAKVQEMTEYLDGSEQMHEIWSNAMASSDWETAHGTAVELRERFPLAPQAKDVILPVLVQTEPTGASVRWQTADGKRESSWQATTPVVLKLDPDTEYRAVFERKGYQPTSLSIQPTGQLRHNVRLPAIPSTVAELEHQPLYAPAVTEEVALVSCEAGRLALVELATRKVRWHVALPDLQENGSNPVLHGSRAFVVGTHNELLVFDVRNGAVVARIPLAGQPVGMLAVAERRLVLPMKGPRDRHRVRCFDPVTTQELWSIDVPAEVTTVPAFGQGRMVLGLASGTILHVSPDTGVELERWRLPSAVVALSVGRDWIYAGCHDGTVAEYRIGETEPRWARDLTQGRPIRWLLARKASLLVTVGNDLLAVQRDTGSVQLQRKGWATGPVVAESDALYVVPKERTVLQLRESDLTIQRMFQADQPLMFGSPGKEFPVLLGGQGAVYCLGGE